jgi:hypothetical protein
LLKATAGRADAQLMFRSPRTSAHGVRAELRRLDTRHCVFQLEGGWFVVGPTGLFVVGEDDGDLRGAATWAARRARTMRAELADQLVWVPCVDPVVVTSDEAVPQGLPCLVVPEGLLRYTVADGPTTVDDDTLSKLALLALKRID